MSLLNNDAVVQYEPTLTDPERLAELASAMGFKTRVKKNHYRDTVVFISGMTCVACVRHIEGSLSVKPGVLFARVSLESRLSYVKYDPDLITAERIRAAIYELGFGASLEAPAEGREGGEEEGAVRLTVEGMTCASCVASVEGALKALDGVTAVSVSLEQGTADVRYRPADACPRRMCAALGGAGFQAVAPPGGVAADDAFDALAKRNSGVMRETTLDIGGMTCGSCTRTVHAAIAAIAGVTAVDVSLTGAVVQYRVAAADEDAIVAAVADTGFVASVRTSRELEEHARMPMCATLALRGMHCTSCTHTIDAALMALPGVTAVTVSLLPATADVAYDANAVTPVQMCAAVDDCGFQASLQGNNNNNNNLYYNSPYGFCLSLSLSVALIWGLYRPSSEPIALRNVFKCSTRHTLHIIRFWHFSSAVIITKNAKNAVLRQFAFSR